MRAAFSHSPSRAAGQKVSRCIRPLRLIRELAFAAAVLILARALVDDVEVGPVLERLEDHPKKPLRLPDVLLSHAGRKPDTRCMAGRFVSPSPLCWPGGGTTERTGRDGESRIPGAVNALLPRSMLLLLLKLCLLKVALNKGRGDVVVEVVVEEEVDEAGAETTDAKLEDDDEVMTEAEATATVLYVM